MKRKTKSLLALLLCLTLTFGLSMNVAATEEPTEDNQTTEAILDEPAVDESAAAESSVSDSVDGSTVDESAVDESAVDESASISNESITTLKAELSTLQQEDAIEDNQLLVIAKNDEVFQETIEDSPEDTLLEVVDVNDETITAVKTTEDLATKIAELEADPNVEYVQPNFKYTLQDDVTSLATTNDPYKSNQWYLNDEYTSISEAWDYAKAQTNVKVAVIDSGIQASHPDLSANISTDSYDFVANTNSMTDSNGHGTHVAGIISAVANNGIGVAGVSYNAKLLCYRVTWNVGGEETTDSLYLYKAYSKALTDGAQVINISLGGYQSDTYMDTYLLSLIEYAEDNGIVTVCAAGNGNTSKKCYPADYDPCISVVATDSNNSRASFSDYNEYKDIAAPGESILSTWNNGNYTYSSGTSMASPVVAGVASLLFAADSSLTTQEVKDALYNTATDLGDAGRDNYYGYGLVNAKAAVETVFGVTSVSYQTHIQDIGWQTIKRNGQTSGTTGQSKRLESIKISLSNQSVTGSIEYKTHIQDTGWKDWTADGDLSGTTGQSKRLEAIRIRLTGEMAEEYDVYYRVHAQEFGWMDWAKNGDAAGTAGYSYRLEAIQIKLVEKGGAAPGSTTTSYRAKSLVSYQTHIQDIGWQGLKYDGAEAGTTGKSKRLEGIKISLVSAAYSGNIQYKTHVQDKGWLGWVQNGTMSGTTGQSKRLEAIQIKLTDEMAEKYDIYYRVHSQNFGWMGWAKNGASAGTSGYSYRLEAIQIKLVAKGGSAPGSTANPFRSK